MTFPRAAGRNPARIVLAEELLIGARAAAISERIAPTIEQVAALAIAAAGLAGRLLVLSAVVAGNVSQRSQPRRLLPSDAAVALLEVDVKPVGMIGDDAVIRLFGIDILNQVIPQVPLPRDFAVMRRPWLDLHNI